MSEEFQHPNDTICDVENSITNSLIDNNNSNNNNNKMIKKCKYYILGFSIFVFFICACFVIAVFH